MSLVEQKAIEMDGVALESKKFWAKFHSQTYEMRKILS